MLFYIYSRKSVATQRGSSVENQIEMCSQYIQEKFSSQEIRIRVFEDEGYSAKNTDRPQFRQMMTALRKEPPDYIVCYRLDRISRSVSDFSALIEELNARRVAFLCIREEFDTGKPMGKAMMYIASVFAQLERETLAQRVRDNMQMLARSGRWLGGTPPFGYTSQSFRETLPDGRVRSFCRLKEVPDELLTVDRIFSEFFRLRSLSALARSLEQTGIRSRRGHSFSPPGLKLILQNPVYCRADPCALAFFQSRGAQVFLPEEEVSDRGFLAYNKRDHSLAHGPRQPMDRWIIAVGSHSGRICGKNWVAVQKLLDLKESRKILHNDYALLSGLLICQNCGHPMLAKKRKETALFDYICSQKLRSGKAACSCKNLNGPRTDQKVWEAVSAFFALSPASFDEKRALLTVLPYPILWDGQDLHIGSPSS